MRKNVTINNYYGVQPSRGNRPQQNRRRNGWAIELGEENSTINARDPFFG